MFDHGTVYMVIQMYLIGPVSYVFNQKSEECVKLSLTDHSQVIGY
jgi:hypothetical protein